MRKEVGPKRIENSEACPEYSRGIRIQNYSKFYILYSVLMCPALPKRPSWLGPAETGFAEASGQRKRIVVLTFVKGGNGDV